MQLFLTTTLLLAEGVEPVGTPFWVPIFIIIVLLLMLWWGLTRNAIPAGTAVRSDHAHDDHGHDGDHHELAAAPEAAAAVAPDDLKIVEGIGPKIEGILNDAGITTLAQLAATAVADLEQIVREDAGIRVAFPDTWPEQAQLAHEGRLDALATLQDELKGGRRV